MASADTTLDRPVVSGLAARAKPRPRPLGAEVAARPAKRSPSDEDGGIVGLAVGSGILVIQAGAIIPGLLPFLLLLLPLALPVVVLGAAAGILVGVPLGTWRLVTAARGPRNGRSGP